MKAHLALGLLAACGGGGGDTGVDAKIFLDAPPVVNQMIMISGTASSEGASASAPLADVVIAFYKTGDETTPVAMATSGADGKYAFSIPTSGHVVDGFLKATHATFVDNYIYPTAPLQADYPTADANMIASSDFSGLGILTGQDGAKGFVAVVVLDGSMQPVAGATIASTPASGKYAYSDNNGYPTGTMGTIADGRAFFVNVPSGTTTVTATKSGIAFKSHALVAHPGALTTTFLTP
jgi:hypothetical protein